MCIDLNQTAFQLANKIKRVLDSDVRIRISLNNATFFEYDSDEDVVIIAPVSLLEIEEKEKAQMASRAAYELVLMSAKTSARKFNGILLPDCFLYCVYSTLHEIGHHDYFVSSSATEFQGHVAQRESLLEFSKDKLINAIASGQDPRNSQEIFARSYRNIPFEKIADDYARRLMPVVLSKLLVEDGPNEAK